MASTKPKGRPPKTESDAAADAAHVINVALMLKQGRVKDLEAQGFTEATALRFALKRRRGLTGDYIGATVTELLGGTENRTQAATRLAVEHGTSIAFAARCFDIDKRNLQKLMPSARRTAGLVTDRQREFAMGSETLNLNYSCITVAVREWLFLPKNTTP